MRREEIKVYKMYDKRRHNKVVFHHITLEETILLYGLEGAETIDQVNEKLAEYGYYIK